MRFHRLLGVIALAGAGSAFAGDYGPAIEGCQTAIGTRLGVAQDSVRFNLEKVKSHSRTRDLSFVVSSTDSANAMQPVQVACTAKHNGDVVAVTFPDGDYPNAIAEH